MEEVLEICFYEEVKGQTLIKAHSRTNGVFTVKYDMNNTWRILCLCCGERLEQMYCTPQGGWPEKMARKNISGHIILFTYRCLHRAKAGRALLHVLRDLVCLKVNVEPSQSSTLSLHASGKHGSHRDGWVLFYCWTVEVMKPHGFKCVEGAF